MTTPETTADQTPDGPDWAQAVDVIDDLMADQHVIGYPLDWLRNVLVSAEDRITELERDLDSARLPTDELWAIIASAEERANDLASELHTANSRFSCEGRGAGLVCSVWGAPCKFDESCSRWEKRDDG